MAKDTITFELGGRVDIRHLEEGIAAFRRLVAALTGDTGVAWVVDDLQPGSAIITIRGEAENPAEVERIVRRFGEVGRALERHEALPHISQMAQATDAIRRVARSVEYVRFETPDDDYTIYGNGKMPTASNDDDHYWGCQRKGTDAEQSGRPEVQPVRYGAR